ncbi:hypothetical protein RLW55_03215 [Hyphomicrobium sp. B1]|uniref:hypothetical protein n=1 Tax=Hyphomicrobium sp. B1 TaxID=3075651 RepID=UPI003C2B727F
MVRTNMRTKQKNSPDWEEIRRRWCENKQSVRGLARFFSVDEKTIRKRAKNESWVRTAGPQPPIGAGVADEPGEQGPLEKATPGKSSAGLEALLAAARDGDVETVATHALTAVAKIAYELDLLSDLAQFLEAVVIDETAGDKSPRRRQLLLKILSFPARAQAARNIGSAMSIVGAHVPGKKARAQATAQRTGEADSEWGRDLDPFSNDEGTNTWKN